MRFVGFLMLIIGLNAIEMDHLISGEFQIRWDTLIMMVVAVLLLFPNLISLFGNTNGKRK